MNFGSLCDVFENIRNTKTLSEKTSLLKTFFQTSRDQEEDLFSVVRLVAPKIDRCRPSHRIKESKITKLLVRMLGLPPGNDKNLLLKCGTGCSVDFGDVIFSVLKKYIVSKEVGLSVHDINTFLDQIANRTSDNGLDELVLNIFRKLSARNIKWFIQIILKDLKLGISDNTILNCFHKDGANFYSNNSNLKKVCEVLCNSSVKLTELEISIFDPFRPMLSKRCDASNFKRCFPDSKQFLIENKFDGERFQLHMNDGQFKYFSRNGFDFTDSYGSSFNEGCFTPFLKNVFNSDVKQVILDGEMMLWNTNTRNFGSKGMNFDVKKLAGGKYQACFCVFDILLLNNKVLTNQPLQKRLKLLGDVIKKTVAGTIVISLYKEAHSRNDIVDALNSSVDNLEEGIVVKDLKSIYKCADRNSGWFKIKMDYFDDVVHDLDVLMMGGSYGTNNKINSFLVGVLSEPNTYFSLGRISSGLNDEQLDVLSGKLQTQGVNFKLFPTKSEGKLYFGREIPDLYIEPQHSCMLQIRASELIRSTNDSVKCPYTLRFPRVLKIREDKPVDECLSMHDLMGLTSQYTHVIKLNKRHIDLDEIISKAKPPKQIKMEVVTLDRPRAANFLKGKRFYVDSGTDDWGMEDIYHCIKRAGGDVSYRLEPYVDIILVSKMNTKIANLMKQSNRFDVIHTDWLKRVLHQNKLMGFLEGEIFSCGSNFKRDLSSNVDQFGDGFMEEATIESLERVFEIIEYSGIFLNTNGAVGFDNQKFASYVAYFDRFEDINNPKSREIYYSFPDECEFEYNGGTVSEKILPSINFVVIEERNNIRKQLVQTFLESHGIVSVEIVGREFLLSQKST